MRSPTCVGCEGTKTMTSLDTNVIFAAFDESDANHVLAVDLLEAISRFEALVVGPVVFAELMASPERDALKQFLDASAIDVKWEMPEEVWESAGIDFGAHARRRKGSEQGKRILPDFLIAAQAAHYEWNVATLDREFFRDGFKSLTVRRK